MSLEQKIYSALTGSTLVTDHVASSSAIYPMIAPQNAALPYILYARISGGQINGLGGYLTTEHPSIQIDIYSTSYSDSKTIAKNVHTVMDATTTFSAILVSDNDIYEDSVELYRVSCDYSCLNLG